MRSVITILRFLWEDLIRQISGPLGIRLRRIYYSKRLQSCGKDLVIDTGVHIHNPQYIRLGDRVWIDKQSVIHAGPPSPSSNVKKLENANFVGKIWEIHIGSNVHIGLRTIIQGHGGVHIGDYFTCSANVAIYSYSNNPYLCRKGTLPAATTHYVESPVQLGDNVWLGLSVNVIGNTIGDNVFIKPGSIVNKSVPANVIAGGNPLEVKGPRFKSFLDKSSRGQS